MHARFLLPAAAALAAGSFLWGTSARAEDPPAAPGHAPAKAIDNAFLTSTVGEWKVTFSAQGPKGAHSGVATSRIAKAMGGTAMVEDYQAPDMMQGMSYHGHGVIRVSADGKTVTTWWFDSMGSDPMKLSGPLSADGATLEGTSPMGPMRIVMKKADGGFDFEGTMNGQPWLSQKYRK